MDKITVLSRYLPPDAAPLIARWIDYFNCEFKVSRSRNSKYGDYRPPYQGKGHRISVNYNLNPYAFLVTTVHEFAHLHTWNEHKFKAKPHGTEWKSNFKRMMRPFFDKEIFPQDVKRAIVGYLENPAASSCTDLTLFRTLRNYDVKKTAEAAMITVEKVKANSLFKMKNGRVFRKEGLIRKRYRCVEVKTGLVYLFNPVAEVFEVE
ncbi:SprT-like domain-containing protein [Hufsiella ginkgonis]|uniref:SprT domain-containing protein n=1 Tax=Hufsiella ginkgonis TaxID=2695274 RepID=A0A7K1Y149_9SPHI|nr:SprT-like domain-containing protein [Hufsiella ginkgonis]MXV16961.1 sprT domain-containing protein [Hufsiella ginkgonis]